MSWRILVHTAKACHPGSGRDLGKTLQLAVSKPQSYGEMVPMRHPMVKPCPPQGSYKVQYGLMVRKDL